MSCATANSSVGEPLVSETSTNGGDGGGGDGGGGEGGGGEGGSDGGGEIVHQHTRPQPSCPARSHCKFSIVCPLPGIRHLPFAGRIDGVCGLFSKVAILQPKSSSKPVAWTTASSSACVSTSLSRLNHSFSKQTNPVTALQTSSQLCSSDPMTHCGAGGGEGGGGEGGGGEGGGEGGGSEGGCEGGGKEGGKLGGWCQLQ